MLLTIFFKYSKTVYQFSKEAAHITGEWLMFWHVFIFSPSSYFLNKIINQHAHQNYTIYHCSHRLAPAKEESRNQWMHWFGGQSTGYMEFLFVNYVLYLLYISKIYNKLMYTFECILFLESGLLNIYQYFLALPILRNCSSPVSSLFLNPEVLSRLWLDLFSICWPLPAFESCSPFLSEN